MGTSSTTKNLDINIIIITVNNGEIPCYYFRCQHNLDCMKVYKRSNALKKVLTNEMTPVGNRVHIHDPEPHLPISAHAVGERGCGRWLSTLGTLSFPSISRSTNRFGTTGTTWGQTLRKGTTITPHSSNSSSAAARQRLHPNTPPPPPASGDFHELPKIFRV
jgi:hypothetical protein